MSLALSRGFHLTIPGAIRIIPYQHRTNRFYSSGKLDKATLSKNIQEFKQIYEFLRRPELQTGELKFRKDESSGIAFITFDSPQKRNAISGMLIFFAFTA